MIRGNYNIYLLVISCEKTFLHVWNETINDKVNNTKSVRREICLLSLVLTAIDFLRTLGFCFERRRLEHGISNCLPEVKVSWWQYQFYFIKNILDIVTALTLWFRVLMLRDDLQGQTTQIPGNDQHTSFLQKRGNWSLS